MKTETYTLEFITPCFCAGANQEKAEIRAPSIRGQLRWWFRALGGTREQEGDVFGTVAGTKGKSSAIVVRVANLERGPDWQPPQLGHNTRFGYIWYFATVAGNRKRWCAEGNLPPGSRFELKIIHRRPLSESNAKLLRNSVDAFLCFGALGMRSRRGMGAFRCVNVGFGADRLDEAEQHLLTSRFAVKRYPFSFGDSNYEQAMIEAENRLKDMRKSVGSGRDKKPNPSALGTAQPRQASAVLFRPVRSPDGHYELFLIEAPLDRVLSKGPQTPLLQNVDVTRPAPDRLNRRNNHSPTRW